MPGALDSALMQSLKTNRPDFFYRALEVRKTAEKWLGYIPSLFQHYTSHGIDHSDEIILQMSKLLFRNDNPHSPTLTALSPIEFYILVVSAYLHDAGMVASELERRAILESDEWHTWVTSDNVRTRWASIDSFRSATLPPDPSVRNYLADLQVRFLLAEYVRRRHHERAARLIEEDGTSFGDFAFGQPDLAAAVAAVCTGHGLSHTELSDPLRFPDERDVYGEKANLRFLAIVLRLGDLLDLRYDRACPLLLNAACPLPSDSYAHWSQYHKFKHKNVTPERIEFLVECDTPDEHRVLHDWFSWIVDELDRSRTTMAGSRRHSDWKIPMASLNGPAPTIILRPSQNARYLPFDWRFELDTSAVFTRLITDVYEGPVAFAKELLQNACDSVRCQMLSDMTRSGLSTPQNPADAPIDWREKYPIHIQLSTTTVLNALSGQEESAQHFCISDAGVGMDASIIQSYLLQVGRSWYSSEDFRRRYSFVPTSRFGIGFLSVFGVSDKVSLHTLKHGSDPIDLVLTGPRNYILVSRGTRTTNGTTISLTLREPVPPGQLSDKLKQWCTRLEFPVVVDDHGTVTRLTAEDPSQFTAVTSSDSTSGLQYEVRSFPLEQPGIRGELYVFVATDGHCERWDHSRSTRDWIRKTHPTQVVPEPPDTLVCFNGIAHNHYGSYAGTSHYRIDVRTSAEYQTLSRQHFRSDFEARITSPHWEHLLTAHLRSYTPTDSEPPWRYRQRLAGYFPLDSYWRSASGLIPCRQEGRLTPCSLDEWIHLPSVYLIAPTPDLLTSRAPRNRAAPVTRGHTILLADWELLCHTHSDALLSGRHVATMELLPGYIITEWVQGSDDFPFDDLRRDSLILMKSAQLLASADTTMAVVRIPHAESRFSLLLNPSNPLIEWFLKIYRTHNIDLDAAQRLCVAILEAATRFNNGALPHLTRFLERCLTIPAFRPDWLPWPLEFHATPVGLRAFIRQ